MRTVRTILFIVNLLLALGLVASTLAGLVAPSQSIYPSLLAFGYVPLLVANGVMAAVWMMMGRWEFLLSVAAIAVRYAFLPLFFQFGGTSEMPKADEHPSMVKLMTYNVHNFSGHDRIATSADSNALGFLAVVREQQPDVLCLQEFLPTRRVSVTDSLELMGFNHYHSTAGTPGGVPRNVVVFSKLPITYVHRIDRTKLLVELMKDGQRLRVCCVHMDSYQFDSTDLREIEKMRHGEVQESSRRTFGKVKRTQLEHEHGWHSLLKPVVEECSVPMVVAGDMNDIPSSYFYHQISHHLTDTYCEQGSGMGITYDGGFPRFRIDMVFRSKGLRTLAYKRIRSKVSDHYPVMVALELEPTEHTP